MASILDRIQSRLDELTKKERSVATAVLANPGQAVTETIAQLARRAQVSEPSVTRFCQRLGFSGFPGFKLELTEAVNREQQRAMELIKAEDSPGVIARKVIGNTAQAIRELNDSLCGPSDTEIKAVARCIDFIAQARRIVILAQGLSLAVGQDFHARLACIGVPSELYNDPQLMMMHTTTLRQGELVLAISATGSGRDVIASVMNARDNGAAVVGLCPPRTHLAELCTDSRPDSPLLHLRSPVLPDGDSMMVSRTIMHTILQIVIEGVVLRRADIGALADNLRRARERSYLDRDPAGGEGERRRPPAQRIEPDAPIVPLSKWPSSGDI